MTAAALSFTCAQARPGTATTSEMATASPGGAPEDPAKNQDNEQASGQTGVEGYVERFFRNVYAPLLAGGDPARADEAGGAVGLRACKPVALLLVCGMAAFGAVMTSYAVQLRPP